MNIPPINAQASAAVATLAAAGDARKLSALPEQSHSPRERIAVAGQG